MLTTLICVAIVLFGIVSLFLNGITVAFIRAGKKSTEEKYQKRSRNMIFINYAFLAIQTIIGILGAVMVSVYFFAFVVIGLLNAVILTWAIKRESRVNVILEEVK